MSKRPLFRVLRKREERGASLVEYGLLVALIAVVGIPAIKILGKQVNLQFDAAATAVNLNPG